MTREEAIARIKDHKIIHKMNEPRANYISEALDMAIKALEQEPCEDAISRQAVIDKAVYTETEEGWSGRTVDVKVIEALSPVTPQPKIGHCKDCKYFEYDSVAKVDGIPLIVAHEICSRWGDGCKTKEEGYCFLFEPQERSGEECN